MSYSIIFETIFVKLSDGRLLHLDRSGCNNDESGRRRDDFTGKIYTIESLNKYANSFMDESNKDAFELKIGNRYCSFYQFGEHLLRMAKRAIPYDELCLQRYVKARRYDGVELLEPEEKRLSPEEFSIFFRSCKNLRYRVILTPLDTEEDIINALEEKKAVSFYVGKRYAKVIC